MTHFLDRQFAQAGGWIQEKFEQGKIPAQDMQESVLTRLGSRDVEKQVLVGPRLGEDCGVVQLHGVPARLAVSMDPITGAGSALGHLAVAVNANDVACAGARPRFLTVTLLMPRGTTRDELDKLTLDLHIAAQTAGIAIIGGHTEITDAVTRPVCVGTAFGELVDGIVRSNSSAQPGDILLLSKCAALEGSAILATERSSYLVEHGVFKSSEEALRFSKTHSSELSVVPEAMAALQLDGPAVRCMHDPTEGGLAGALHELADAANVGFVIRRSAVPLLAETVLMSKALRHDPLTLISSGALLIVARPDRAASLARSMNAAGHSITAIGELCKDKSHRHIFEEEQSSSSTPAAAAFPSSFSANLLPSGPSIDGNLCFLPRPAQDALWNALEHSK